MDNVKYATCKFLMQALKLSKLSKLPLYLIDPLRKKHMYSLLSVLSIAHRIAIIGLLIAFSVVPLVIETSIFINYVLFPSVFILLSISTIYIENTLNKYQKQLNTLKNSNKDKKCLIRYGICCLCH